MGKKEPNFEDYEYVETFTTDQCWKNILKVKFTTELATLHLLSCKQRYWNWLQNFNDIFTVRHLGY